MANANTTARKVRKRKEHILKTLGRKCEHGAGPFPDGKWGVDFGDIATDEYYRLVDVDVPDQLIREHAAKHDIGLLEGAGFVKCKTLGRSPKDGFGERPVRPLMEWELQLTPEGLTELDKLEEAARADSHPDRVAGFITWARGSRAGAAVIIFVQVAGPIIGLVGGILGVIALARGCE